MMRRAIWMALALVTLAVHPVHAQDTSSEALNSLIGELNEMIDRGERDRLADPWFLHDLRELASRYANPFGTAIYAEEFQTDGAPPAPWQVLQGDMRSDWRSGLRSVVRTAASSASNNDGGSSGQSGGDVGQQLLGAILRGVVRSQGGGEPSGGSDYSDGTTPAIAIAPVEITNAYRIEAEISVSRLAENEPPRFELGVYQTVQNIYPGYRLRFDAADGTVSLIRVGSRGQSIVQTAPAPDNLMDGEPHIVGWSRFPDGGFTLSINGKDVFSTLDRGFSDPWNGLFLHNAGGDLSLRRISVAAADGSSGSSWARP